MNIVTRYITKGLLAVALLVVSAYSLAQTIEITASFTPSIAAPDNNEFTNTTPLSGYCAGHPDECAATKEFSIDLGLTASLTAAGFSPGADPRDSMYFKMPGAWRNVTVVNGEGQSATLQFRVSAFSAQYHVSGWSIDDHRSAWVGSSFNYAASPCMYSGVGYTSSVMYQFMWKWPVGDVACYKIANRELTGEPTSIDNTSISYELKTPDPLRLASGEYTGVLHLNVGPGGDVDFGNSFSANDSVLDFKFKLTVTHELKLTATADNTSIALQPCATDKICTADEGKANWERWMVSRITPQLTGRSNFSLTSSGGFTVYLDCAEQSGSDCALKSDNNGQLVPVKIMLNLPDNIVDSKTSATVSKRLLIIGRDVTNNVFNSTSYGENRPGSLDFLVKQRDVDTMLKTRPDTYRGTVTVIFDPNIY